MIRPKYCYWSVCDGPYCAMMEHCVRSARSAGVFKEFHVLTDRPVDGCECYDCFQFEKEHGLFKLHYLKVGMSRLNFEYFIWIDADSIFVRNPVDVLSCLGKSPIHVPLEVNLSVLAGEQIWKGVSMDRLRDLFRQQGIVNQIYLSQSAFWIIHHDAIESVYDLALGFWHRAKEARLTVGVEAALGYAMQILCADPEGHLLLNHSGIWASDDEGRLKLPNGKPWSWRHPLNAEAIEIQPAIIHLPLIQDTCRKVMIGTAAQI